MSAGPAGGRTVDHATVGRPMQGVATGRTHTITVRRQLVPVVFVPGIMGSRLVSVSPTGERKTIWDPDDEKFMFSRYVSVVRSRPRTKKQLLIGKGVHDDRRLVPFVDDAEHNARLSAEESARAWGGLLWRSYGEFLRWLIGDFRARRLTLGELFGQPAALVETPVFAFPYDWTSSCAASGAALAQRIPAIIAQARQELRASDLACPGVLLVTHSMGGLVARAACQAGAPVVGVVHGVQPAAGAAAAYWRMKAGFPRQSAADFPAMALGKDGREVVALLGNMPGGLELLPTREYRTPDGSPAWLHWPEPDGSTTALPRAGDPATEIYAEARAAWRLVPDPAWLDPASDGTPAPPGGTPVAPPAARRDPYGATAASAADSISPAWVAYVNHVAGAAAFHARLAGYQHPRSTHFWGAGGSATPATVRFAAHQQAPLLVDPWTGAPDTGGRSAAEACVRLNAFEENWGAYVFWQPVAGAGSTASPLGPDGRVWRCELRPADAAGDGTVPVMSGRALAGRQGSTGAFPGIEHEPAYNADAVRRFVGGAIARLLTPAPAPRNAR